MTSRFLAAFVVFALPSVVSLGCKATVSQAKEDPADASATSDTGADLPVVCDDGAYRTAANSCQTFPALAVARSDIAIAPTRDHHATTIVELGGVPWLYVFGGTRDEWSVLHNDVQRARIEDDGSIDAFEKVGSLAAPRAGHCVVHVKDRLLIAGGVVGAEGKMGPNRSTLLIRLADDGSIAEAAPGPDLPTAVYHLSCDVEGGFVYVLGGIGTAQKSTSMSARAAIRDDGTLGAFEAQTPLSPDRSHHAAFIREKRLYVVGGLSGAPSGTYEDHKDAIFADIAEDGSLGAWTPAGNLPKTVSVSAARLYKDAVYVVGGLEGTTFTDAVRRATFELDGTLSAFETVAHLPSARGHVHQTPMWKDAFYSVAGKDDTQQSLGTVDIGRFE